MSTPTVSVVIPAYQRAHSILRSIDSALAQTMSDLEVIVVDDGSTDGTIEIVRAIPDARVRLLVHETNRGGNAARQTGIDAARGQWVAFLDSDDLWVETKLARQLERLAEMGPDYRFCYTWYDIDLGNGTVLPPRGTSIEGFRRPEFLVGNVVGTFSTMLIAHALLDEISGLNVTLPSCQDWDLVIRANRVAGICVVPMALVHYSHADGDPHRIEPPDVGGRGAPTRLRDAARGLPGDDRRGGRGQPAIPHGGLRPARRRPGRPARRSGHEVRRGNPGPGRICRPHGRPGGASAVEDGRPRLKERGSTSGNASPRPRGIQAPSRRDPRHQVGLKAQRLVTRAQLGGRATEVGGPS